MQVVCEGPGTILWVLRHFLSLISRLLVAILVFPVTQMVKNLPMMQETWVRYLGQKDPLEKGLTIQSSILAWRIPWKEEPGRPQSMWSQRVRHDWVTNTATTSGYTIRLKTSRGHSFCPFWCLCQKLSLSLLYCIRTLLHRSSEWSGFITGPKLNSSLEAKNRGIFCVQQQPFRGDTVQLQE